MRALRLSVVCLAVATAVLAAGASAVGRRQPLWVTDPITYGLEDPAHHGCHPQRTGPGLGNCGYPVGPILRKFISCKDFESHLGRAKAVTFFLVAPLYLKPVSRGVVDIPAWRAITQIIMPGVFWKNMDRSRPFNKST